jgi:hypothetical protein
LLVAVSRVLAIAALAACYRSGDRCAVAGACADDAPPPIDVAVDSRVTGPPPCTLPDNFTSDIVLTAGDWFGATFGAEPYATKRGDFPDSTGQPRSSIFATSDDVANPATTYAPIKAGTVTETYQSPRLSFDGHELFTRADRGGTVAIARAFRSPLSPSWSLLQDVDLRAADGSPFLVPAGADVGVPTQTTPRRMILVYGAVGFDEFEENVAASTWELHLHHGNPAYEEAFFGQAHLTADGLRLVYVHQLSGGVNAVYVVERPDYESMFLPAARRLATATSASRPYFTPDCKTLFSDDGAMVHMTSY